MRPLRWLLPLLLFANSLPCQDPTVDAREQEVARRMQERERRAAEGRDESKLKDGKTAEETSDEQLKNMTPEERLAHSVKPNTAGQCRFVTTIKPEKLMPGQSGTMLITALFNGQAVMPFPAPVEMLGARKQGIVDLGELTVRPAEVGTLSTAYHGRPVYDNFAVMEVPIVMSPTAELGRKQQVALQLRFDIYDGMTAQPIGRFVDRVSADVEVGQKADPAVQGAAASPPEKTAAPTRPDAAPSVTAHAAADAAKESRVVEGQTPAPVAAAPEAAPKETPQASHDWSAVDEGDGVPMPVWIGGGVALLLLILVLARKKA